MTRIFEFIVAAIIVIVLGIIFALMLPAHGHIERSIEAVMRRIRVGGKIAVITFHSIEDRLVKNLFSEYTQDVIDDFTGQTRIAAPFHKYTKKPIEPTEEEIASNPRSRSAKMRVLEKVVMAS